MRPYVADVGRAYISARLRALADQVDETGEGVSIVCLFGPAGPGEDEQPMAFVHAPDAFGAIMHAAEFLTRVVDDVPSGATSL